MQLINLWPSVRTLPPSSVSAPFYGYLKLKLRGSEESRNRRWSHWESNWGPPAQKAVHLPIVLRLLLYTAPGHVHHQQSVSPCLVGLHYCHMVYKLVFCDMFARTQVFIHLAVENDLLPFALVARLTNRSFQMLIISLIICFSLGSYVFFRRVASGI